MVLKNCSLVILSVLFSTIFCWAGPNTIFEGYYKVLVSNVHAGFAIQRYDYDPKTKQFTSISFLRTGALGGNIMESLKAVADEKLSPISYDYNTVINDKVKTIKATFKNGRMHASIQKDGQPETVDIKLPKGAFLSTFLQYLMLQAKDGIQVNNKYDYSAIAEEDAKVLQGSAFVKTEEDQGGIKTYKVANDYKNTRFISVLIDKGEVVSTKSPTQGVETILVKDPAEASQNQDVNTKTLKLVFGEVPEGKKSILWEKSSASSSVAPKTSVTTSAEDPIPMPPEATPVPGAEKKYAVPPGKGLILKGEKKSGP